MKRNTCVFTLLVAVLAALVLPSTARAAADISHFRGKTAVMEFYSLDPTNCITTSVTVFATENRFRNPPEPPTSTAAVDFTIYQFNGCTWESLVCASGSFLQPDLAFDFANNLASASFSATSEVYDFCGDTTWPITLAVTWTGDGEVVRGRSNSASHSPGFHVSYRQNGRYRDATGSGSLTLGGTPLPLENGLGYLSIANSGTITIYH